MGSDLVAATVSASDPGRKDVRPLPINFILVRQTRLHLASGQFQVAFPICCSSAENCLISIASIAK